MRLLEQGDQGASKRAQTALRDIAVRRWDSAVEVVTSTEPTPKIDPGVDFKATAGGFSGKRMLWRELIPQD